MKTFANRKADRIDKLMGDLNEVNLKKAMLLDELNRSMDLQRFMPGVFKDGAVSVRSMGNPCLPKAMRYIVTEANGRESEYVLLDVPEELWAHMKPKFRAGISKGMVMPKQWRD